MGYRVERLSLLFTCKNCTINQMFIGDSLNHVIEKAKAEGWTLPWKIKNIKPTVYESTEDIFCPACSQNQTNEVRCDKSHKSHKSHKSINRYVIQFPQGSTIIDGKSIENSILAGDILEFLRGTGDLLFNLTNFSGWRILHQINDKWIELIPRTSFTEKEICLNQ